MKTKFLYYTFLLGLIINSQFAFSQNAKKFFKTGNDYADLGNYEMAIEQYTKAIELDQKYEKAIAARAQAYEQLSDNLNAAEDYESLFEFSPKEYLNGLKASSLFLKSGNYKHTLELINTVEKQAPEMPDIFVIKAKCNFALEDYLSALEASNKAVRVSPSPENYFLRGLINSQMKNYTAAEQDFSESAKLKPEFTEALVQQATVLFKQDKNDESLKVLNDAINKGTKDKDAFILRSKIKSQMKDYNTAIDDLSKAIAFAPDPDVFFERGNLYLITNQFNESVHDFSKVIQAEKDNLNALEKRALGFQKLNRKSEAVKDLNLLISKAEQTESDKTLLDRARKSLFELEREYNKPKISLLNNDNEEIQSFEIADGITIVKIKVKVDDESPIKEIYINDKHCNFDNNLITKGEIFEIDIQNFENIEITALDVYQNKTLANYKIIRHDEGLPKISLSNPVASESGFIYLRTFEPEIYVEGQITGQNFIDSIKINNLPVGFNSLDKNPTFRQRLQVIDLNYLTFIVKDNKGNRIQKKYTIDRSDAELFNDNPMGRTWVVFIENSEYSAFTNLESPKKEVDLMIKALSKYKIDKIIHKRNLTKSQMNYFFSNELKNLVNEGRVNSLLIWYTGHGKLVGENGFWIPVDSKIDDASTYFNINTLKTVLKPYLQNITHSLIVTDACETGPSFYMSMRDLSSERNCSDGKSTKSRSSQVFTSSTEDFKDGDSKFTTSFANALMFDNNSCVPIERIVTRVSNDVIKSNQKRPVFGKIAGFEDENGTFLFIKK